MNQKRNNRHPRFSIYLIFAVFIIGGMVACTPKQPSLPEQAPEGIISRDSMIMIMTDCFIAEGASKQVQVQHKNVLLHANVFFIKVFEKYDITYQEYKKSLEYYHQYPRAVDALYDDVLQQLSEKEAEIISR
jgi:hypothetical protein